MKISARNQLKGRIINVTEGAVNSVVAIELGGESTNATPAGAAANTVKANITMEACEQLGLREGKEAYAIIKASNVMFAAGSEPIKNISARNQLPGIVSKVKKGAVNGHISLELANGASIMGSITNEAIEQLGLEEGKPALAIVKSTDIIVGVD